MQHPSLLKPILILTSAAILLAIMHSAAGFLTPILLGFFLATLLSPAFLFLIRKRVPKGLALLLSIGLLVLAMLFLAVLIGSSVTTLTANLLEYSDLFSQRQAEMAATLAQYNLPVDTTSLLSAVDPEKLAEALNFTLSALLSISNSLLIILLVTVFVLAEGPLMMQRLREAFGTEHFLYQNTTTVAHGMISYFGLRALVNLVTATATGLMLWVFGIDSAGLWAVLIFFLSFIPYLGAVIAMIPPLLLAYAEGGLGLAAVILGLSVVINGLTENIVAPMVMGKGLSISPTVVFLSYLFWMFILGGPGAFLAMPLTLALILFMSSFEETRGIAAVMQSGQAQAKAPVRPAKAGVGSK
jgi:predicted PurR-regulated permease PerM